MSGKIECHSQPRRTVASFWPFLLWGVPIIAVYTLGYWELDRWCGREILEQIALPLVLISVVSYGLLAWRRGNEFAKVVFVLSLGIFCREWHFSGTSKGIYILIVCVIGWAIYRRKKITALIKDTPVEIWIWAAGLCYVMSQLIARRAFGESHLNILPMEERYHILLEESVETMAHLILSVTSLFAWRQFDTKEPE
jgi:hypothetical protein